MFSLLSPGIYTPLPPPARYATGRRSNAILLVRCPQPMSTDSPIGFRVYKDRRGRVKPSSGVFDSSPSILVLVWCQSLKRWTPSQVSSS
ncbi:hypothetical protein AVEN_233637-1 [Araneus ventricosus]|uniref:Uncharacterized protein n=1 Tax=Araneus ventricosus TaxID=182803 RepID=A0A4Y2KPY0_ARAVE|nr:hypothetical protein AVEN_233637-1 [Araneus ventricosus]